MIVRRGRTSWLYIVSCSRNISNVYLSHHITRAGGGEGETENFASHVAFVARVPIHTERVSGGGDDDDDDAPARGTPRRRAHPCRHPRPSPPHPPPGFDPALVRNGIFCLQWKNDQWTDENNGQRAFSPPPSLFFSPGERPLYYYYLPTKHIFFVRPLRSHYKILAERIINYNDGVHRMVV